VHISLEVNEYLVKANQQSIMSKRERESAPAHKQALVCLSDREIVDWSRGQQFHCKMANNRSIPILFFTRISLVYLAIWPFSIIMAFGVPPSTVAVAFCFSETRACT